MKKILPLSILSFLFLCISLPHATDAASVNLFPWEKQPLTVENNISCYFSVIEKFKGKYYSFQGQSIDLSGNGKPFVAMQSEDGITWTEVSEQFGRENDISIVAGAVLKNSKGKKHLYVAAKNTVDGVNVYRTKDGVTWKRVIANGMDNPNNTDIRAMGALNGKLYFFTQNAKDNGGFGSMLFTSSTGKSGDWKTQTLSSEMRSAGASFAGTLNFKKKNKKHLYLVNGIGKIFRTADGKSWKEVPFDADADIDNTDEGIWVNGLPYEITKFNGYIYVATFGEGAGAGSDTFSKVFRSRKPMKDNWKELNTGIEGEELYYRFAKNIESPQYMYFTSYPSAYMYRIGKGTKNVERISEANLSLDYSSAFIDAILIDNDTFYAYGSSLDVYVKQKK